jgi:hypothetical protein
MKGSEAQRRVPNGITRIRPLLFEWVPCPGRHDSTRGTLKEDIQLLLPFLNPSQPKVQHGKAQKHG